MPVETYVALALIFFAVTAAVFGVATVLTRQWELRGRLRDVVGGRQPIASPGSGQWQSRMVKAFEPVAKLATPKSEEELSKFRQRFLHAGFRHPAAPVVFFTAKAALAIGLPLLGLFLSNFFGLKLSGQLPLLLLLVLAAIGYYLPNAIVSHLTEVRQRKLFEAFPDALDLMIVCVEALRARR